MSSRVTVDYFRMLSKLRCPAYALKVQSVITPHPILILFRAVAPLFVYQRSTGRDSDELHLFLVGLSAVRISGKPAFSKP